MILLVISKVRYNDFYCTQSLLSSQSLMNNGLRLNEEDFIFYKLDAHASS